jgi:serralysin
MAFDTTSPAQMMGLNNYTVDPVFTVGETIGNYTPVGLLDGLGAFALDGDTIRVLANHELSSQVGYAYELANGTELTGARVSYFDINVDSFEIEDAGLAFDTIYNRAGESVDDPSDLEFGGLNRFCSAQYIPANQFGEGQGIVDNIFFTGEETGGGTEYALDAATGELWAVPAMGVAAWESVTEIDTGNTNQVAFMVGDDRAPAPLILYVGEKNAIGDGSFLDRNGLAQGQLYVWVSNSGDASPEDFRGTGNSRDGQFVAIDYYRPDLAGTDGYDDLGYATQDKQDELAYAAGAFSFSRPEDIATNPADGTVAVLNSTGRSSLFGGVDSWGTTYTIDVDFSDSGISANVKAIYDGDDAGGGQFAGPDYGIRSQDNLDWADDGYVYINEDRALGDFGTISGEEASIWRLDPNTSEAVRIGQMDRAAVPDGQSDPVPNDIGNWESSGILDVSELFGQDGGTVFLFDVQAHSLEDGIIADQGLVEGGQLAFLTAAVEGTAGDDEIAGINIAQTIAGLAGADIIQGGAGDDVLRGDQNSRSSRSSQGGDDIIYGGAGNDRIGGKAGDDILFGEAGDDQIWGDIGDDILRGGLGNDTLTGDTDLYSAGADIFILAAGEGTDTITDFKAGLDLIGLDGISFGELTLSGNSINLGDETLAVLNGVDTTTLTAADFTTVA